MRQGTKAINKNVFTVRIIKKTFNPYDKHLGHEQEAKVLLED